MFRFTSDAITMSGTSTFPPIISSTKNAMTAGSSAGVFGSGESKKDRELGIFVVCVGTGAGGAKKGEKRRKRVLKGRSWEGEM